MKFSSFLSTLALASTALAGQSVIRNQCPFTVYITSVDITNSSTVAIASGGSWSEPQRYIPGVGIAIKIGTSATAEDLIQFAYTAYPSPWIYYDLNAAPKLDPLFEGQSLVLSGSAPDAPVIEWNGLAPSGTSAYWADTDLVFTLC
ncbi:hypothetical protein K504DRAFT_506898 [Pleomassaria siparia CBS 279.74]|uniref:Uncharacterized protein n=1 Tax=Pleomassaria siparia CBS 279.74 TaxID=1314801 RepID=A0A6G1JVW2_9PLEO|nr:hypothetical protein K504DRAFT_506898 [Pleomassaria siparia CBS 279.74]